MKRLGIAFLFVLIWTGWVQAELIGSSFPLVGRWNASEDPLLLGDYGLQDIQNLRRMGIGLKGVLGHTQINTVPVNNFFPTSGFHYKKDFPVPESHVLIQAFEGPDTSTSSSHVYQNTNPIPYQGEMSGTTVYSDEGGAGIARMAYLPKGDMVYTNGKKTLIWGGNEKSAVYIGSGTSDFYQGDFTRESISSGDSLGVPLGFYEGSLMGSGNSTYTILSTGANGASYAVRFKATRSGGVGGISFKLRRTGTPGGSLYARIFSSTGAHPNNYPSAQIGGQSDSIPTRDIVTSGSEFYHFPFTGTNPEVQTDTYYWAVITGSADYTFADGVDYVQLFAYANSEEHAATDKYDSDGTWNHKYSGKPSICFRVAYKTYVYVNSERPGSGVSFYFTGGTSNFITGTSTEAQYWAGTGWSWVSNAVDGTLSGSTPMVVDGPVSFDSTVGLARPGIINGLGGYWYRFSWSGFLGTSNQEEVTWESEDSGTTVVTAATVKSPTIRSLAGTMVGVAYGHGTSSKYTLSTDYGRTWGAPVTIKAAVGGTPDPNPGLWYDGTYLWSISQVGGTSTTNGLQSISRSSDNGATWADFGTPLNKSGHSNSSILVPRGTSDLLALINVTDNDGIVHPVVYSYNASDGWNSGVTINSSGTSYYVSDAFQTQKGNIICNLRQGNTLNHVQSISSDKGKTWTAVQTIVANSNCQSGWSGIGEDPYGNPISVFSNDYYEQIQVVSSSGDTGNWEDTSNPNPILLVSSGVTVDEPSITRLNNGEVLMAYYAGVRGIRTAKYGSTTQRHIPAPAAAQITLTQPWQEMTNVWSGEHENLGGFMIYDGTKYEDNVDEVIDDVHITYVNLSNLATSKTLYLQSPVPAQGFYIEMLSGNTTAATITVSRYTGRFENVGYTYDGTRSGSYTLGQSGYILIDENSNDQGLSINGSFPFYCYRFQFSAQLSAVVQLAEVRVIEAPDTLGAYRFGVEFQGRSFLFDEINGSRNRGRYSASNSASIFNGTDSSSLYFGTESPITSAISLYNVFRTAGYYQLLVTKEFETYRLYGTKPADWEVQKVSGNVGCNAPLSMQACELIETGASEDLQRQVVIWQSAQGPVMCDGAVIRPIYDDIRCYWDQADSRAIPISRQKYSAAMFDPNLQVYKLFIASGSGATTFNTELEFSLKTGEWTKIKRQDSTGPRPLLAAFPVWDTLGGVYTYGSSASGYVYRLENSPSWSGTTIESFFHTKDILFADKQEPFMTHTIVKYIRVGYKTKATATSGESIFVVPYGDGVAVVGGVSVQAVPTSFSMNTGSRNTQGVNLGPFQKHSFKVFSSTSGVYYGPEITNLGFYYEPIRGIRE